MLKNIGLLLVLLLLAACAERSENISASYVPSGKYENYSCKQVAMEQARVAKKVSEIADIQDRQADSDTTAAVVGTVIFWPALFFMMEGDKEKELSVLKGEMDALDEAAVNKECSFTHSKG